MRQVRQRRDAEDGNEDEGPGSETGGDMGKDGIVSDIAVLKYGLTVICSIDQCESERDGGQRPGHDEASA